MATPPDPISLGTKVHAVDPTTTVNQALDWDRDQQDIRYPQYNKLPIPGTFRLKSYVKLRMTKQALAT